MPLLVVVVELVVLFELVTPPVPLADVDVLVDVVVPVACVDVEALEVVVVEVVVVEVELPAPPAPPRPPEEVC